MPLTNEQRAAVEQARALANRLQANTIAPSWHTTRPTDDMYRASQAIQHLAGVIDALLAENAILRIDLNEWREVANDRLQAEIAAAEQRYELLLARHNDACAEIKAMRAKLSKCCPRCGSWDYTERTDEEGDLVRYCEMCHKDWYPNPDLVGDDNDATLEE